MFDGDSEAILFKRLRDLALAMDCMELIDNGRALVALGLIDKEANARTEEVLRKIMSHRQRSAFPKVAQP